MSRVGIELLIFGAFGAFTSGHANRHNLSRSIFIAYQRMTDTGADVRPVRTGILAGP